LKVEAEEQTQQLPEEVKERLAKVLLPSNAEMRSTQLQMSKAIMVSVEKIFPLKRKTRAPIKHETNQVMIGCDDTIFVRRFYGGYEVVAGLNNLWQAKHSGQKTVRVNLIRAPLDNDLLYRFVAKIEWYSLAEICEEILRLMQRKQDAKIIAERLNITRESVEAVAAGDYEVLTPCLFRPDVNNLITHELELENVLCPPSVDSKAIQVQKFLANPLLGKTAVLAVNNIRLANIDETPQKIVSLARITESSTRLTNAKSALIYVRAMRGRNVDPRYVIVAGVENFMAARLAKMETIMAVILKIGTNEDQYKSAVTLERYEVEEIPGVVEQLRRRKIVSGDELIAQLLQQVC